MKDPKVKATEHQRYMKTQFSKQAERHSPCLELCTDHAFGPYAEPHDSSCPNATILYELNKTVTDLLSS